MVGRQNPGTCAGTCLQIQQSNRLQQKPNDENCIIRVYSGISSRKKLPRENATSMWSNSKQFEQSTKD